MLLHRTEFVAALTLAWVGAAAWVWKAVSAARGMRQLPNLLQPEFDRQLAEEPSLAVIVPACNEAASIEACVRSLLAQDYSHFHIVAVDDRSVDSTGAILDRLVAESPARLTVLHVRELPAGWLGKTHAMDFAARHAQAVCRAEWLLFTDGDILFHPEAMRRSLVAAEEMGADHLVTLPTAIVGSPLEAVMLGFLQVLGVWALRLWKVADPRARDAVGIGAFNLLRTSSYQQIGGFEALRMQILDDLLLARRVKSADLRQRVALAPGYVRVHWATGLRGIVRAMTKNLFAVVQFRIPLLLLSCAGVLLLFLAPYAGLFWSPTRLPALITLCAMLSISGTMRAPSRIPVWTFLGLPLGAAVFLYALLRSSAITLWQGGVVWRGAFYSLSELRRHTAKLW